ncbi:hypothetical protein B7494_g7435 [Chlorociboria aeruginascens]|nr:hypothetical protein B7494_g7435 [Chlorociboria aeruginascens]
MAPPAAIAESANPLLLGWVWEWLETARERNTKGFTVYKKAYDSLKACPISFSHPSEAQQLTGFGPKLCTRLTDKMKQYCEENGLPMPAMPRGEKKNAPGDDGQGGPEMPPKKKRKLKPYVPALRSGSYALVLALATLDETASCGITKAQTIELAQPHCDSSFTAPSDPTKFYTAWNSMKTLVEKDLVYEKGRPLRKYSLTEEGWEVARRIKNTSDPDLDGAAFAKTANGVPVDPEVDLSDLGSPGPQGEPKKLNVPDIIPRGEAITDESFLPAFSPAILPPGSFEVRLVLDVREIRAKQDRDYMQNELAKKGVTPLMRALELGDILWVAKLKDPDHLSRVGGEGNEIVLDWIVERKRLDDLISSIKDGRFHEQKFRLRKSGMKNVIYIIEEIRMSSEHATKYEEAVESAIASTQVVEGYFVKKTLKMDDTIQYLTRMTLMLKEFYEDKPLHLIPTNILTTHNYQPLVKHLRAKQPDVNHHITYKAFASLVSKSETLTLRDIYLKMLMCTKGVTGEKSLEIQKRWKTPIEFLEAFDKCGSGEEGKKKKREMLSNEMSALVGRRKIAKTLSIKIAEVWGGEL